MLEETLLESFATKHPTEMARALRAYDPEETVDVLQALSPEASASLLRSVAPVVAARSLELLGEGAGAILVTMPVDDAAPILRAMDRSGRARLMDSLSDEARRALTKLLRYSPRTAGALMDPKVLAIADVASVAEALDALRRTPQHSLYYVYLVAEGQKLVGVANIRELMDADPDRPAVSVAARRVEALPVRASWESIVAHPGWDRFHAMPVVEAGDRFVGVIRYETLRELERRKHAAEQEDQGATTAAALGEVYGLGLRGLFEWAASAVGGPQDHSRRES